MSSLESLVSNPLVALGVLTAFVAVVVLVTRHRYRMRIRRKGFEFLIEPHNENGTRTEDS